MENRYGQMNRMSGVTDRGFVLKPDREGEAFYNIDGGGMRDVVIAQEQTGAHKGRYYMSYDGAIPGKTPTSYWNVCVAVSDDLIAWRKCGPKLMASAFAHPESNAKRYKDFCGALSPWDYFENNRWYRFYLGADDASPTGIPSPGYFTLLAEAETLDGPFEKRIEKAGCEKHVCFPTGKPGSWDDATASPGAVLLNPAYVPGGKEKKYIMLYSGSCSGVMKRSLGVARTDCLAVADDYDKPSGNFWLKDPNPILPPEHDIENSSVYFERETGLYWLFTNHVYNNTYTDSVWAYWSTRLDKWDAENCAVVFDATVSLCAKGAIGMPSVVQKDARTLYMFYDAIDGDGIWHHDRKIGLCEIPLPIKITPPGSF